MDIICGWIEREGGKVTGGDVTVKVTADEVKQIVGCLEAARVAWGWHDKFCLIDKFGGIVADRAVATI